MFARRTKMVNRRYQRELEAETKPIFDKKHASTVQEYFTRVVGAEVRADEMRCGGAAVQHALEEKRTDLVGAVKGVDGVVEILKQKYQCNKGQRFRVIGDHGGPAGHWKLEGGKTVPKTHYKEGGWKWVLDTPEPVEKVMPKGIEPMATIPPPTKGPSPVRKKDRSASPAKSQSASSSPRKTRPKAKKPKGRAGSEELSNPLKKRRASQRDNDSRDEDEKPAKRPKKKPRPRDDDDFSDKDEDSEEAPRRAKAKGKKNVTRRRVEEDDSRDDVSGDDSRSGSDKGRGKRPAKRR